jgi:tRNA pseudouridine32 synthase/23S rRNA pseudouridine746 synthase|tara:strand:+ start:51 stop:707 length:657 start_codon:yes stop_codon:yes gene_type:complete
MTKAFKYNPPELSVDILYHDRNIIVVNKPSGLLSVPGKGELLKDCLISRLQKVFPDALLVHRLDLETSGVMLFALTPYAQRHLGLQFEKRQVKKTYIANVWGNVENKTGEIEAPIIVDWPNRPRQKICWETGKSAFTKWRVLRKNKQSTRLRLMPTTGRSHQLRVHMLSIGHVILGDKLYAKGEALEASERLQLHSESIKIRHPEGGKGIVFKSRNPF